MARPSFQPTDEHRKLVKLMKAGGIPEEDIAKVIGPKGISVTTLRKHFEGELDVAASEYGAKLIGRAFQLAMQSEDMRTAGSMTMFLCKTRLGWRETNNLEHTGKDGGPIAVDGGMPPITIIVEGVADGSDGTQG